MLRERERERERRENAKSTSIVNKLNTNFGNDNRYLVE